MCFTVFSLLGHQKRSVFVCLGRNGSDGQACHVPGASWPSKSYQRLTKGMRVLQCLGSWAIKNIVFSHVLGVLAPMGKLVTCLGRLGRQNRPKESRNARF